MIDFVELKGRMSSLWEADKGVKSIETGGRSLEDAVHDAALQLSVPSSRVQYEVLERGIGGIMGWGGKEWKILAYAVAQKNAALEEALEEDGEGGEMEVVVPLVDGDVFVQLKKGTVFLKVTAPSGGGEAVTVAGAAAALKRRRVQSYNMDLVTQAVKAQTGEYTSVGTVFHNAANDSFARVEISADEMHAYITLTAPGIGGGDVSYEDYITLLNNNGVSEGIKTDFLTAFSDRPSYGQKVCVAEGKAAVNGCDSYMDFFFDIDTTHAKIQETKQGSIDFKELNLIQNVMAGQALAKKIPAERGKAGKTIFGRIMPAQDGKDIEIPVGTNVHIDQDGSTIIADKNGQVVLLAGKICVEEVFNVDGNVGIKTGNIMFLGSVTIKGDIEEGYSVKAAGNIQVTGAVNKGSLEAEGDVIVQLGITGKQGVLIKAGRTVAAKFIENAIVKSGDVLVSDGILNSTILAQRKVVCEGKRAVIAGGKINACEEIFAKILGSASGSVPTLCEVGYDPEVKERITVLMEENKVLQSEFDEIQLNINTLEALAAEREMQEEKKQYLEESKGKRSVIIEDMKVRSEEIASCQSYLDSLKTKCKISAAVKCFPGTEISIRDVREKVRSEYKGVTFTLESGIIKVKKYEETPAEEAGQ